nr:hypothetical protein [Sunxiuqinia sp.]
MINKSKVNLTGFLIYLKHHVPFIWKMVEILNSLLFRLLYGQRIRQVVGEVIARSELPGYVFRRLEKNDLPELERLLRSQPAEKVAFFKPHGFGRKSLEAVYANPAFPMMGVFDGSRMAGYFFLRCFWNKKCFVGRLVDTPYEGRGLGRAMNGILYPIAWQMGFRCLSTISKNNRDVMRSHAGNPAMRIVKELSGDYMLVEFVDVKLTNG